MPAPPWGTLIALYLIAIGLPSGLGLVGWWFSSRGTAADGWSERWANIVSLVALIAAGVLLIVDLGRPGGFYLMLTRFDNLTSPISVGAKLIAAKTALLGLSVYARERGRRLAPVTGGGGPAANPLGTALRRPIRIALVAASFGLAVYPAALLSRTWSSPLGGTSGAALLFLTTSLLLGTAAAVAIVALSRPPQPEAPPALARLRSLLLALLTCHAIAIGFQALAVSGDPRLASVVTAVATGEYAVAWWAGIVGAGIAAPVAVLVGLPRHQGAVLLAAAGAAVGAGTTRYLLFAAGG